MIEINVRPVRRNLGRANPINTVHTRHQAINIKNLQHVNIFSC